MRSYTLAASAALFSALVAGQTFTDCDPTKKVCDPDPALGRTLETDFTKGKSSDWELADGTTITYDPSLGAEFIISKKTDAPTVGLNKYIMFGKVEVVMRASAGTGTVSSFILESSDLDEIDWEWLGSDHGHVQSNFYGKGNTTTYDRAQYHVMSDPINDFHTYTIDWTAESTKWYIDGALIRTLNFGDALALGGKNYPQTPMKVKMGNWIGCADEAAMTNPKSQGTCQWAGGPIDLNAGPYTMYVKSVTVQDYGCASEYTYSDMSGSYESIVASGKCNGEQGSYKPSSSAKGPKPTAKPSSASTAAPILIETKTSLNASGTQTSTKTASTVTATTLTIATSTGNVSPPTGSATPSGTATTSGAPAEVSANAASGLKAKKYGGLDVVVAAFGLGMGYLIM